MPLLHSRRRTSGSGARIKAARERAGLSQLALANRVGCKRLAVIRIEGDRTWPRVDLALRIARELDATVEELFGGGR